MDFTFDDTLFYGIKDKIAIVAVGYNRLSSLSRLLCSLNNAEYPSNDIPLIISLDYGGGEKIHDFVENFQWSHGKKICIFHKENMKLRKHIFSCISLTKYVKGVIILEDDLYVSPVFYYYTQQALNYYGDDNRVSGISLYSTATSNFNKLPLYIMHGKSDVYAAQMVETWGECFNYRMWKAFNEWYENNPTIDWEALDMYEVISSWKSAWSKYYFAYMISNNKYYLFPYTSLSTCFSDAGVHAKNTDVVNTQQVIMQFDKCEYVFYPFDSLFQYDVYFNPCGLAPFLNINEKELTVDFYGNRKTPPNRYILSPKIFPYLVVKSFGVRLKPIEANVYYNIKGENLFLYDTYISDKKISHNASNDFLFNYYFDAFFSHTYFKYINRQYLKAILAKINRTLHLN